jgi:uncharacterized membrane-anchored protein
MSTFSVEGSQNRFSPVDDNHHAAYLWIASSLSLTYFLIFCILRVYISHPQYTADIILLIVAAVCIAMNCIIMISALSWSSEEVNLASRFSELPGS